jgi:hypothetical protein
MSMCISNASRRVHFVVIFISVFLLCVCSLFLLYCGNIELCDFHSYIRKINTLIFLKELVFYGINKYTNTHYFSLYSIKQNPDQIQEHESITCTYAGLMWSFQETCKNV